MIKRVYFSEEFDKKYKSFNAEYKKKDALLIEQHKLIEERNRNIKQLTERIKMLERRLELESNPKDLTIKQLKKELDAKANQIATLTYQLHNANKSKPHNSLVESKESLTYVSSLTEPNTARNNSPNRKKKSNRMRSEEKDDSNLESKLTQPSKSTLHICSERRMSSDSVKLNFELSYVNESSGLADKGVPVMSLKSFAQDELNSSNISSVLSERSDVYESKKVLPPVIKRPAEAIPPPDPKPFLQSAASTLHSRSKKELLQRRTLIALPQIKSFEVINQLAVESPHKTILNKTGSQIAHDHHHHNNNNNNAN